MDIPTIVQLSDFEIFSSLPSRFKILIILGIAWISTFLFGMVMMMFMDDQPAVPLQSYFPEVKQKKKHRKQHKYTIVV